MDVIAKVPIRFYNTEKREKQIFSPLYDNVVKLYTCGPTIYDFAHIGNFRTYIFEDLLRRTLKFFGYQVVQVMNLTDVDDKTIRGATEKKVSLATFVQPFKNSFFVDLQSLNIERAEYYPAATDYIAQMIDFIQKLIDKNFAYKSKDNSIYYSIEKCPSYGRLSHLHLRDLKVGASDCRVTSDEYDKESIGDFVLWKAYDPKRDGDIFWDSPFGPGRPGWHLECSTMAMALLGEMIDIHVGAVDNIFPHHENEIAQSEAYSGKPFVKYWMHAEHLLVNHKKMSKSLGNFYTLRDLLGRGYHGPEIRYLLMQGHYRTQLNFTFEALEGAKSSLLRINDFIRRLQEMADAERDNDSKRDSALLKNTFSSFCEAMADDLNVSVAIATVFDLMHEVNTLIDKKCFTPGDARGALLLLQKLDRVFGVMQFERKEEVPEEVRELLEKRQEARGRKEWKEADFFRDEIAKRGYVIEDTPKGARLKLHH